jgi:hypothetical protein
LGDGDGTFGIWTSLTRGDAAIFLHRARDKGII